MKKILYFLAGVTLILSGCEIPFLDAGTDSTLNKENFYTSLEDYEIALNGIYGCVAGRGVNMRGSYVIGIPVIGEAGTDECRAHPTSLNHGEQARELDLYDILNGSNDIVTQIWNVSYDAINRTNELLAKLDEMEEFEDPRYAVIDGECRFLQALWYFNLVRIYGGVPVVIPGEYSGMDWAKKGRDPIQAVYEKIDELLLKAIDELQADYHGKQHGRANKIAAQALYAKVNLHIASSMRHLSPAMDVMDQNIKLGGLNTYDWTANVDGVELSRQETITHYYTRARDYAKMVLDHFDTDGTTENILMPNFTDNFGLTESSKEILFEGVMSTGLTNEQGGFFGSLYGPHGQTANGGGQHILYPITAIVLNQFTFTNTGTNNAPVWGSADDRFLWTISTFSHQNSLPQKIVPFGQRWAQFEIGKFRMDKAGYNQDRVPVNNPILRTSDVCLIYAEAQAELDGAITPEALKYLNVVRDRAGIAAYTEDDIRNVVLLTNLDSQMNKEIPGYTDVTDMGHFRRAILNERMRELIGEGHRWFDLVRLGLLKPLSTAAAEAHLIQLPGQALPRKCEDYHIFRPVPSTVISVHGGNIEQNYGYTF